MKTIIYLFGFTVIFSCSDKISNDNDIFQNIAKDNLYHNFHKALANDAYNIANGKYDLERIHEYWINTNSDKSFCDIYISPDALNIRGILEYQKSMCDLDFSRNKLVQKYPIFDNLNKKEYSTIRKYYKENYADVFVNSLKLKE